MPRMHILTPAEYAVFETPPVFTTLERQRFFDLPPRLEHLLGTFRTPTNQLCFVLTLGYFRATQRFFARQFHDPDAIYVARQLGVLPGMFDLRAYEDPHRSTTPPDHSGPLRISGLRGACEATSPQRDTPYDPLSSAAEGHLPPCPRHPRAPQNGNPQRVPVNRAHCQGDSTAQRHVDRG